MSRATPQSAPAGTTNLLLGKLFTSPAGGTGIANITDGSTATRWISSVASPTSATVDSSAVYTFDRIVLVWAGDTTKDYTVDVSMDGTTWNTVHTGTTNGLASPPDAHTVTSFSATPKGRYIRISMLNMQNATYGNSLWEVEAYGARDYSQAYGSLTSFTASVVSTTQVDLAWAYSGDPLANVVVKRDGTTLTTITNQSTTTYTDSTVSEGNSYNYTIVGTYAASGSTNTLSATANISSSGGGTRVARDHPFTSDSVWNLPIVPNTATYDVSNFRNKPATTQYYYANYAQYSHGVWYAQASDPIVTCSDNWGGSVDWWLPSNATVQAGTDEHLEIVSPDGTQILEMITAVIASGRTSVSARNAIVVDLYGDGMGPRNGVRAYGGSAVGGLIREYDVAQGVIDHSIAIAIDMYSQLAKAPTSTWDGYDYYWDRPPQVAGVTNASKQPGWIPGQPRNGFGQKLGYVWPASEQDYYSDQSDKYNGAIPMGAYFCIPTSVNVNSLGLNSSGLMVAKALQKYGAYITDATEGTAFYVERKAGGTTAMSNFASGLTSNAASLIWQLRRVSTNDENNPNGGPLNHASRPPLLPNLV